ncbi:P-loop containing nucleoside triphosphate hydrolase protein [Guyanagaster necrorhizus]|uniref:P-loop containing nucleoside triphosphate hydrolase protein n=1 Tax=Guyanagaster necrorhizus TaxID=856835 RepID=A0A9P7VUK6_9AGAR|nr:P-loop containing nucleoside triphosphate hydrolase protein [Guyanagaster necrorhizus MCA 3950]KAG7446399.1 P-loop containing nucleoside triphosphate hydrolase protein [Guyanagaster necrorhizus MCA 3950]
MKEESVTCPICSRRVLERDINAHIDDGCPDPPSSSQGHHSQELAPIFTMKKKIKADNTTSGTPRNNKRSVAEAQSSPTPVASKRTKISSSLRSVAPLAERMRPANLEEFIGHSHLTSPDSLFMSGVANGSLGSMIFWGPPGCGKTTLARLFARRTRSVFKELSATVVGISEVRAVFEEAKNTLSLTGRLRTILFLDEVHRFNKAQQDIFLPFVEQGQIQLIGATTENPSFKLTGALLSRCRVFVLERLTDDDIQKIISQAIEKISPKVAGADPRQISSTQCLSQPSHSDALSFPQITDKVIASMVSMSTGDARTALSLLELVVNTPSKTESDIIASIKQSVSTSYDRTGDSRYDMISALHKCVRGGQGSAAMYWMARMLTAGEDPLYIARRMVVCASEDIGLADNHALPLAMATLQACQTIGMPECRINLAHLVAYLSEAPKSTRAYEAYKCAEAAAKLDMTIPVPMQIRNAPTELLKEIGCSKDYHYNPDYAHPVHNNYMPIQFEGEEFLKKVDDRSGKIWDEAALREWELLDNHGRDWEGRS